MDAGRRHAGEHQQWPTQQRMICVRMPDDLPNPISLDRSSGVYAVNPNSPIIDIMIQMPKYADQCVRCASPLYSSLKRSFEKTAQGEFRVEPCDHRLMLRKASACSRCHLTITTRSRDPSFMSGTLLPTSLSGEIMRGPMGLWSDV